MAAHARVQLCGRLEAEVDDRDVTALLPGRQGRLLFAYLVLERGRPITRDALIAVLWPDGVPATADGSLSALLSRLRKALGGERLSGRSELTLDLGPDAQVDVEIAFAALARAQARAAAGDWDAAWADAQAAVAIAERELLPSVQAP